MYGILITFASKIFINSGRRIPDGTISSKPMCHIIPFSKWNIPRQTQVSFDVGNQTCTTHSKGKLVVTQGEWPPHSNTHLAGEYFTNMILFLAWLEK